MLAEASKDGTAPFDILTAARCGQKKTLGKLTLFV